MPETAVEAAARTLRSGYVGQGPQVDVFERELGNWLGNDFLVTVNSGTSALQLALQLSKVGPGDTVISTPMTCLATNAAIRAVGADIIWADIDPRTGLIDPEDVARLVQPNTKAIMVVHWAGRSSELTPIQATAEKHGLKVIEDAAHALGSTYQGRKIGNHSDFVCFSFQAVKQITTGDGGALACKSQVDYDRAKLIRWYGLPRAQGGSPGAQWWAEVSELGHKWHMNDIAASMGVEQMKFLDGILAAHRENSSYYRSELSEFGATEEPTGSESSCWLHTIHVPDVASFQKRMQERGIEVSQVHARNDRYSAFRAYGRNLPGVTEFTRTMVCIPVGWWIGPQERETVAKCVRESARP